MSTNYQRETTLGLKSYMDLDEIKFLQDLFMNSDRFVYYDPPERITAKGSSPPEPDTLKVALISFKMPPPSSHVRKSPAPGVPYESFSQGYRFVRFNDRSTVLSAKQVVDYVAKCIDRFHRPDDPLHFLLFNELAVSYQNSDGLIKKIRKKLDEKNVNTLIGILGSYHCENMYCNVAPIVSPFMDPRDPHYEEIYYAPKQNAALKQRERVRTTDSTEFVRYLTPYGVIMVWICLDMYDPNLVIKLLRVNNRLSLYRKIDVGNVVDILFIPSYNADLQQNIHNMAMIISKYARTTIFVCNDSTNIKGATGWNENICYHHGRAIMANKQLEEKKFNCSVFSVENWRSRHELRSRPFDSEHSSLFCQILGMQGSSFKSI